MSDRGTGLRRAVATLLWVGGGGAVLALVFVFSFFTAMRFEMRSTEVRVPDLGGLSVEEARGRVAPLGLVLQVVEERNDPRVASGRILDQVPSSDSSVRRGRKVKLVLSRGGRVLTVPDLIGHADRAVAIELRQEGFVPGDEARVPSRDLAPGLVLAQVPPAGTSAVPNARVHRLVSDGPPAAAWVMPDLTGRSRSEAERWIETAGFRRGEVRRVAAAGRRSGTVVAQAPLAGYPVRAREIVEISIAE
jgi:serine/threonine-protein kinase